LEAVISKRDITALELTDYDGKTPVQLNDWHDGHCTVGKVSGGSIGYVLKYMSKPRVVGMYNNDDRIPEFSLMSKGIGLQYISDSVREWHLSDIENRMYVPIEDGKKISMCRYYKDKLYDEHQRYLASSAALQRINRKTENAINTVFNGDVLAYQDCLTEGLENAHKQMHRKAIKNRNYE
jgi:hypothetical protein